MFKLFFETLSMLSMGIQLFNSVNNSECMKQHYTPFKVHKMQCRAVRISLGAANSMPVDVLLVETTATASRTHEHQFQGSFSNTGCNSSYSAPEHPTNQLIAGEERVAVFPSEVANLTYAQNLNFSLQEVKENKIVTS